MDGTKLRQFDWSALARVIHPLKVAIIEALRWTGEPLSSADLEKVFYCQFHLSTIAYHVRDLAKTGVLEAVGSRPRRGATETFYFFAEEQ